MSTVASPNFWAVHRPEGMLQVHGRSRSQRLAKHHQRAVRHVEGCPDIGIVLAWQTAPGRFTVQSDSDWDWTGDKGTRNSMPAGNIRCGQRLRCRWRKHQTVIRPWGAETMARELRVRLDATELQVDTHAATGIIGRQRLEKARHMELRYSWLQVAVRGMQVTNEKVQSENNMADLGTKAPKRETFDRHMEQSKCASSVRRLTVEEGEERREVVVFSVDVFGHTRQSAHFIKSILRGRRV